MEDVCNCECRNPSEKNGCVNYPNIRTDLNSEPFRGSFQQLLESNIGKFVTIEFLLSSCELRPISGYVESVTGRYVVLRNPKNDCRLACDAWTIKIVSFPCCN